MPQATPYKPTAHHPTRDTPKAPTSHVVRSQTQILQNLRQIQDEADAAKGLPPRHATAAAALQEETERERGRVGTDLLALPIAAHASPADEMEPPYIDLYPVQFGPRIVWLADKIEADGRIVALVKLMHKASDRQATAQATALGKEPLLKVKTSYLMRQSFVGKAAALPLGVNGAMPAGPLAIDTRVGGRMHWLDHEMKIGDDFGLHHFQIGIGSEDIEPDLFLRLAEAFSDFVYKLGRGRRGIYRECDQIRQQTDYKISNEALCVGVCFFENFSLLSNGR